jgi:hypothetical protein
LVFVSIFSKNDGFDAPLLKFPVEDPLEVALRRKSQIQKVIAYFQKVIGQGAMICCTVGKRSASALCHEQQKSEERNGGDSCYE